MTQFPKTLLLRMLMITVLGGLPPVAIGLPRAQVNPDPQVVARLTQFLERSGYPYQKVKDNVWVVSFKGKSLADINVLVTSAEGLVIAGVVVAPKSSMKVNAELLFKVLRFAHEVDRVKVGLDDDEDLFLRAEVSFKGVDLGEFKSILKQVSSGADKLHAVIRSHLLK